MNANVRFGTKSPLLVAGLLAAAFPVAALGQSSLTGAVDQAGTLVQSMVAQKNAPQASPAPAASAAAPAAPAAADGENHTISASGFDSTDDAQTPLNAITAGLKKAGYNVLSGAVTSYPIDQTGGTYTIGGDWGYQYNIVYIGPEAQTVQNSGYDNSDDATAAMNAVVAKLGDYAVLSQTVTAYALPEYGTYTIGGSWAYEYSILYIAKTKQSAAK